MKSRCIKPRHTTGNPNRRIALGTQILKGRKQRLCLLCVVLLAYTMTIDTTLLKRTRALRIRDLNTIDKGSGNCDIGSLTDDGNPTPNNATRTLLVSYPGSGKRFTWTIIKALTNAEVADDWDFSGKLRTETKPLVVKTSWPHKEGIWSWGTMMDQVILLVRNPRKAIPSYHNMKFELQYAETWSETYAHIFDTYKERPGIKVWEAWRDENFDIEIDEWYNFIDFWAQGGYKESTGQIHDRCQSMEIDCRPKAIIDFDAFYRRGSNSEFLLLNEVLDGSANVEVVSSQIRTCVFDSVFKRADLHQGGRPDQSMPSKYSFTLHQYDKMYVKLWKLWTKYGETNKKLAETMQEYWRQFKVERYYEVRHLVDNVLESLFGDKNCDGVSAGYDLEICTFLKDRGYQRVLNFHRTRVQENFPYEEYLKEKSNLARFYFYHNGPNWTRNNGWMGQDDPKFEHCHWFGIRCTDGGQRIKSITLPNNGISGDFNFLVNVDNAVDDISASHNQLGLDNLEMLEHLDVSGNFLVGRVPDVLCKKEGLTIIADAGNCDNEYDASTGHYGEGCCSQVVGGLP